MIQIKAGEVVLDYNLYPRHQIDKHHVGKIREAMRAGIAMPPLKLDRKSKRATDGFHRDLAYLKEYGPDHLVDAIDHPYKNEKDMFLDAMRLNAQHGRNLTAFDKAHSILLAQGFGLNEKVIAGALSITVDRVQSYLVHKTALKGNGTAKRGQVDTIAIKRTIHHMAGERLTKDQQAANDKLSGMNQLFYVNQLLLLFDNDLLDRENAELLTALRRLGGLIEKL